MSVEFDTVLKPGYFRSRNSGRHTEESNFSPEHVVKLEV